jgi:hypothetical protein
MSRPKKDGKYLNVYIQRKVFEEFADFCEDVGQSKSTATERALELYMQSMKKSSSIK